MGKTGIDRADFHLKIIQEISDLVNQRRGLASILDGVVRVIADSLGLDVVSIYLFDPAANRLVMRATRGLTVSADHPVFLSPEEGLTGQVFSSRETLSVMPASSHPAFRYFPEIGEEKYESYLGVPILLRGRALGVLVGQTAKERPINPAEETLFETVASRLAGLLEVADRLDRLRAPEKSAGTRRAFTGKGVSGGFAAGPVVVFRGLFQRISVGGFTPQAPEVEEARLARAVEAAQAEISRFIEELSRESLFTASETAIFQAHEHMLSDTLFLGAVREEIRKGRTAEASVVAGAEAIAARFESRGSQILAERAGDVREIGERLLHALLRDRGEKPPLPRPTQDAVIVAEDLGPSYVARMGKNRPAAIVTTRGGETSHTAILAQSLGIPAVVGADSGVLGLLPGSTALVDGKTGFVFADPGPGLIAEYEAATRRQKELVERIAREVADNRPGAGAEILVDANIGFPADVAVAQEYGLTDVGLFRTEFTFMRFNDWPDAAAQAEVYGEVARAFPGRVTVRTLDIGADKILPYFRFPDEENPLLGLRSIRFSMEHLDLFREQVRGILLASAKGGRFRVLLPMVSRLWEVETARDILAEEAKKQDMAPGDTPPLGVMMEVPGLITQLRDLAPFIDFISVGTNDLIQYLLAVDRNSNVVGHLYSGFHPAVLRLLALLKTETDAIKKEITVCGEMAGTPAGALALAAIGFNRFSLTPKKAPAVKHLAARLTPETLAKIRDEVLAIPHEKDIRHSLEKHLDAIDPILLEIG